MNSGYGPEFPGDRGDYGAMSLLPIIRAHKHLTWLLVFTLAVFAISPPLLMMAHLLLATFLLVASLLTHDDDVLCGWTYVAEIQTLWQWAIGLGSVGLILCRHPDTELLVRIGAGLLEGHSRMLPLLLLLLLVVHLRLRERARLIQAWGKLSDEETLRVEAQIEADREADFISWTEARRRREDLRRSHQFFGNAAIHARRFHGQSWLCLFCLAIGLGASGGWRALLNTGSSPSAETDFQASLGLALLMTAGLLMTLSALSLLTTYQAKQQRAPDDMVENLPDRGDVARAMGAAGVELGLALAGLPPGISLALHALSSGHVRVTEEAPSRPPLLSQRSERCQPELFLHLGENLVGREQWLQIGFASRRNQIYQELGIRAPDLVIHQRPELMPNRYRIGVAGTVVEGEARLDCALVFGPESVLRSLPGHLVVDPASGRLGSWLGFPERQRAQELGLEMVGWRDAILNHVCSRIRARAPRLLGNEQLHDLLIHLRLPDHLLPKDGIERQALRTTLSLLLAEHVPVGDLPAILAIVKEGMTVTMSPEQLANLVRVALSPCRRYLDPDGALTVIEVVLPDPRLGQHHLLELLARPLEIIRRSGLRPIAVTALEDRYPLRRATQDRYPDLIVLSHEEIPPEVTVHNLLTGGPLRG